MSVWPKSLTVTNKRHTADTAWSVLLIVVLPTFFWVGLLMLALSLTGYDVNALSVGGITLAILLVLLAIRGAMASGRDSRGTEHCDE